MKRALFIIVVTALLIPAGLLAQSGNTGDDSVPTRLATPVLTATAGETAIELAWDEIPHATNYQIWGWSSSDGWIALGSSFTGGSFSHGNLTPDTRYYYTIKAIDNSNRIRSSDWSAWADAVAPNPPKSTCDLTSGLAPNLRLRQETLDAHHTQYGGGTPTFLGSLIKVVWHLDGQVEIWYGTGFNGNYRVVSELWKGCEFVGHTPWKVVESLDNFR